MEDVWITQLVTWLPLIVFVLLFLLWGRRQGMRARGPSGRSLIELYEQQVEETRRTNAVLERIATALERRAAAG